MASISKTNKRPAEELNNNKDNKTKENKSKENKSKDNKTKDKNNKTKSKGREAKKLKVETNTTLTPPTFKVGDEEGIKYLNENGYVVWKDVIDNDKNNKATEKLWDWMESLGSGIKRNKRITWDNKYWPEMFVYGIFDRYGIGQSDFMWYLRHECRSVFEFICGTKELLCSLDGCSVFRPWLLDNKWKTSAGWWHFDCSKNVKQELSVDGLPDCIQGALCLTEATAASGGFACVPKSHLKWDKFFETYTDKSRNHWAPIELNDPICEGGVRILAPKNSMICWNSKLVHCNAPGSGHHSTDKLLRVAAYISMQSSKLLNEARLSALVQQRKTAINKYASTSHWSIFCQPKTARYQRSKYSNPITPPAERQALPDLTDPKIKDLVEGTFLQTAQQASSNNAAN